jgi:hypothetical protein
MTPHHMPVDTIKIGKRIGRGLGDLPFLTADFANAATRRHSFALPFLGMTAAEQATLCAMGAAKGSLRLIDSS